MGHEDVPLDVIIDWLRREKEARNQPQPQPFIQLPISTYDTPAKPEEEPRGVWTFEF